MRSLFFLAVTTVFVSTAAHAAPEQRLPGVIDKPLPAIKIPADRALGVVPRSELDPMLPAPKAKGDAIIATLNAIDFEGNKVVSDEELQAIAKDYIGRPISNQDVAELKYEVTREYYTQGYILVRVVTPEQSLSKGVLKVKVYEAGVGNVQIQNPGVLNETVTNAFTGRLEKGQVFSERNVESVVSDLNDLPGIRSSLNLRAGREFKTTDLNLALSEADEDTQRVYVDNYGSELTGQTVATVHLEKSNFFNLGEKFSTDLRKSNDELWSVNVGASTPIALSNIMLDLNYLHSENEIGDRLANLNADGETDSFTAGLSSHLLNTRLWRWDLAGGLEARNHQSHDITQDTNDDIRQLFLTTSVVHNNAGYVVYAATTIRKGINGLGASQKGDVLNSRAGGDPEATLLQPLFFANVKSPITDGDFKLQASGQVASATLLSSDLFAIGGYGSVRGFEPAQETGEAGWQFNLEYNHNLPINVDEDVKFRAGPFVDGAAVYNRIAGSVEDTHLYSAGLGFEANAKLLPVGDTRLRLDWAHTLGDYTSAQVNDDVYYFRITQAF